MQWNNSDKRYGIITKLFHWLIFILFTNQFIVARIMVDVGQGETVLALRGEICTIGTSRLFDLLGLALLRYVWRRTTRLPDWDSSLTDSEKTAIHWFERIIYLCMVLMPLSGYIFVMAGGFGVNFFGQWQLFDPIGKREWLADIAHWTTSFGLDDSSRGDVSFYSGCTPCSGAQERLPASYAAFYAAVVATYRLLITIYEKPTRCFHCRYNP